MACGDRYRHLIRNSLGRTWESPCNLYCNAPDHESWRAAAVDLLANKVQPMWDAYDLEAHAKREPMDPVLVRQYTAFVMQVGALPETGAWRMPDTQTALISEVVSTMELGACVLEQTEDRIREIGGRAPSVPGVGESNAMYWIAGAGLALGGAAYLYIRNKIPSLPETKKAA